MKLAAFVAFARLHEVGRTAGLTCCGAREALSRAKWISKMPPQGRSTSTWTPGCKRPSDATALSSLGIGHVALRLGDNTTQECVTRTDRFGAEGMDLH